MSLYLRESGPDHAPTILFLHGGGLSGRQWQPQMEQLAEYHCLAPDLPEQGQSSAVEFLSLDRATEQVVNILRAPSERRRVHVVASSFGGTIALNLLRVAPKYVETVVVSGTAAGLGRLLGSISLAGATIYRVVPLETLIKLSLQQFGIPEQYRPAFHNDLAQTASADFTRKVTRAMMQFQLPTQTSVPVLAVVGQKETLPAKLAAHKIARMLPKGRGVMAPGVGHVWNLQAPDLFSAMVRAWITRSPLPAELRPLW